MASRSYEGRYKVWLLEERPAEFDPDTSELGDGEPEGERTITETELEAGTRLERLTSDGGFTYTYTMNTASQALIDKGKVSHNVGTREISSGQIQHEIDHPLATDLMWALYEYGDEVWLVVCPDCPGDLPPDGAELHVLHAETGEPQTVAPSRDAKQNFQVGFAVQDWDLKVTYDDEST